MEFMAAEFGQRVLLIDLDPQTNPTKGDAFR